MKTMKRSIALALSLIMILSLSVAAQAASAPKHTEKAEVLYELGLFKGTGTNADGTPIFSLQNKATRLQALIILIRLLGLEEEALATMEVNPFTDIPNGGVGEKYAAYAYSMGLTKGVSADKFGNSDVTPAQFATFVLRALGYTDIRVADAIAKGREIGLISSDLLVSGSKTVLRDECVAISYNALKTKLKGTETTLLDKLVDDGAVSEDAVAKAGILNGQVKIPVKVEEGTETKYVMRANSADILAVVPNAVYGSWGSRNDISRASYDKNGISLHAIWSGSNHVKQYLEKGSSTVPPISAYSTFGVNLHGEKNHTIMLALLDKDFNLVAYNIIPPGEFTAEETSLTLTVIPPYDGVEEQKKTESKINNVKTYGPEALSCEKIVTKYADGREEVKFRLRINESKWPSELKGLKYYTVKSGGTKEDLLRYYNSSDKNTSVKTYGGDDFPNYKFGSDSSSLSDMYIYVLDDNLDVVALIQLPSELPVVETVVAK